MTLNGNGSIRDFIKSNYIVFEEVIVSWLIECVMGIDHLVRIGLHHSDIKPDNLLLDSVGGLRIGDMGLVQEIPLPLTPFGRLRGTVEYLPNEALTFVEKTITMDIWSAGVTFFELVTGALPWRHIPSDDINDRILNTLDGHHELYINGTPEFRARYFVPSVEFREVIGQHMLVLDSAVRSSATNIL